LKQFIPALLWGITILLLSTVGGVNPPDIMPNLLEPDKIAHAGAYGVFSTLLIFGFARSGHSFWKAVTVGVLCAASYGALMEVVQYSFFPNRYFEVWDIVANIIGCLMSILVSYFVIK
jgi:VanZ family protein